MASKKQTSEVKIHVAGLTKDFGENHVLRGIDIDSPSTSKILISLASFPFRQLNYIINA